MTIAQLANIKAEMKVEPREEMRAKKEQESSR